MKLYFAPGACSLAPHICLREAGIDFDLEQVDLAAKKTNSGDDYWKISPNGYVPALQLDDGEVLTEVAVIVQYVADLKLDSSLMPRPGTMQRYRAQEWLNFISSELHKSYGPPFNPAVPEAYHQITKDRLAARFDVLTRRLNGNPFLMGRSFSAPDAYLFTVLSWSPHLKLSLDKWPGLVAYLARVGARPAVQAAFKAEGLT